MERKNQKLFETVLGKESAFHNPYTFIPFPNKQPERYDPVPLTADEPRQERNRYTGLLRLRVTTARPLMTCDPIPVNNQGKSDEQQAKHKSYQALTIGDDVIVPATGIRGSLRTLMTIINGGTISYLDEELRLCQGRDVQLVMPGMNNPNEKPVAVLAKVVETGSAMQDGVVELGLTKPVRLEKLKKLKNMRVPIDNWRKVEQKGQKVWFIDDPDNPGNWSDRQSSATPWQVRLSGQPVGKTSKNKNEGAFKANGRQLTLPSYLWGEYSGRNRHSVRKELRPGDLIWMHLKNGKESAQTAEDVVSLQWARWGRLGQPLSACLPKAVQPDYRANDGMVDDITNLFGQVSPEAYNKNAPSFAGRIVPENLVFCDTRSKLLTGVTLAPLQPPHPSCMAFYRNTDDPAKDPTGFKVRGYKVYRNSAETGPSAPWHFATQGVYDAKAQLSSAQQGVNKTVDLLPEGMAGELTIAIRSLDSVELAMLLQACHVPWRLGGGKPLGLGLCNVEVLALLDEEGNDIAIPTDWQNDVNESEPRAKMWAASQKPVPKLRYPRAVDDNNNRKQRGGHAWFKRHADTKKNNDSNVQGLISRPLGGELRAAARSPQIPGQPLPLFDPDDPLSDVLYGYDMIVTHKEEIKRNNQAIDEIWAIEPFSCERHIRGNEISGGNTSQNRETRLEQKGARLTSGAGPQTPPLQKPAPVPVTPAMPVVAKGAVLSCVITEPPAGKTSLWATVEGTELTGIIEDHDKVPTESRSVGTKLPLYVISYTVYNKQIKFGWARANTPSLPARPKPSNFNRR